MSVYVCMCVCVYIYDCASEQSNNLTLLQHIHEVHLHPYQQTFSNLSLCQHCLSGCMDWRLTYSAEYHC